MPDNEPKTVTTTFSSELTSECQSLDNQRTRTGEGSVSITRTVTGDTSSDDININIDDNDIIDFNNLPEGFDLNSLPDEDISGSFNTEELTKNVVIHDDYTVTGDGIFDDLMETATKHLTAQFEAGRIRGEDYATSYTDIYKTTLATIVQLWSTIPEIKSKILLTKTQAMLARAQAITAMAESKYALVLAKSKYYLAVAQAKEADAKVENAQLQSILTTEQAKLTAAQTCAQEADIKIKDKQLDLSDKQIQQEDAKTRLVLRQTEGFAEDYKQKILKILMDGWSVYFSTMADSAGSSASNLVPAMLGVNILDSLFNTFISSEFDYSVQSNLYENKYTSDNEIKQPLQTPNTDIHTEKTLNPNNG